MKKKLKRILFLCGILAFAGILTVIGINLWVTIRASAFIYESFEEASNASSADSHDCILILGAGLYGDKPSPMLKDRLDKGIALYQQGAAPKLIMSGDHGQTGYNEVQAMKQYAMDAGVPSSDIFMDHAGFSTYDSIIRARDIFGVKSPIVVTQKYHMYRAIFIGTHLGINGIGIPSDGYPHGGKPERLLREYLARCKDVITVFLDAKPTYSGAVIPINGNGDVTND